MGVDSGFITNTGDIDDMGETEREAEDNIGEILTDSTSEEGVGGVRDVEIVMENGKITVVGEIDKFFKIFRLKNDSFKTIKRYNFNR
jgi:hypothetical protein